MYLCERTKIACEITCDEDDILKKKLRGLNNLVILSL